MRHRSSCTSRPAASSGWRSARHGGVAGGRHHQLQHLDGRRARPPGCRAPRTPRRGARRAAPALRTRSRSRSSSASSQSSASRFRVPIASHGGPGSRGSSSSQAGAPVSSAASQHRRGGDHLGGQALGPWRVAVGDDSRASSPVGGGVDCTMPRASRPQPSTKTGWPAPEGVQVARAAGSDGGDHGSVRRRRRLAAGTWAQVRLRHRATGRPCRGRASSSRRGARRRPSGSCATDTSDAHAADAVTASQRVLVRRRGRAVQRDHGAMPDGRRRHLTPPGSDPPVALSRGCLAWPPCPSPAARRSAARRRSSAQARPRRRPGPTAERVVVDDAALAEPADGRRAPARRRGAAAPPS